MSSNPKRPYSEALPIAEHIREVLAPYCDRLVIAGSLRRQRPMIGDIELVGIPQRPYKPQLSIFDTPEVDMKAATSLDAFLVEKKVTMALNGAKLKRFTYRGMQVDLFLPLPTDYGWRLVLSTGSSAFNKWLVTAEGWQGAMPYTMKSDDGSLWRNGERLAVTEEATVFEELCLAFIPLTMRDDGRWLEVTAHS